MDYFKFLTCDYSLLYLSPFDLRVLLNHEETIYLLSAVSSLTFALVIYSLIRSARILQEKKWVMPFAYTFLALAALYVLRLIQYLLYGDIKPLPITILNFSSLLNLSLSIVILICSGVTNYLFIVSGFFLSEPALGKNQLHLIKKLRIGRSYLRSPLLWLLCIAGLVALPGEMWRVPDAIFSVVALIFMGFALYRNRGFGTDKVTAWIALLSSIAYAVIYFLRGIGTMDYLVGGIMPGETNDNIAKMVLLLSSIISLILKFGLFFSGYALMLLISGPLQGIERLLDNVTRKQEEYLESDGIVKSISEELPIKKAGLYIKLPGSEEKRIALYSYPSANNGKRQGAQEVKLRDGESYTQVMKSGEVYSRALEKNKGWLLARPSKIGVPVLFHNSIIACLEVEIGERKFTETDRINLERIATLISPAVQAYRELAALNQINQDVALLQLGVEAYDMERDVREITDIIHNVMSPLAIGISIKIGFTEYWGIYSSTQEGLTKKLIREKLDAQPDDEAIDDNNKRYRWFDEDLAISMTDATGQKVGEQVFGKFIFATDRESKRREHPTLGTNATSLRAISNLLRETLLGFIRGHLNQVTDQLGVGLSGLKGTTPAAWLAEVERAAQEAKLLWAVASYGEDDLLGNDRTVELVKKLKLPEQKENWEKKDKGLWLCKLAEPEIGTYRVIKIALRKSKETLWLGVSHPDFGHELDYISPWRYFLDHFCEIADSALQRILIVEERNKHMAKVQSIVAGTMTVGIVSHRLITLTRALENVSTALESPIQDNARRKKLISSLRDRKDETEELLKMLKGVFELDKRRPCLLDEAINRALELVDSSLATYKIEIQKHILPKASIDIPFHAAANALAIVVDNAKDAIRDGRIEDGLIKIEVREAEHMYICDITDNGKGVPPKIQKTLLNDFSKSDKENSHGIGLYFSVFLLRVYGGDIILTSPGSPEQRSTTFSISFPK